MNSLHRFAGERIASAEAIGAMLALGAMTAEQVHAHGQYHFDCRAPSDENLGTYIALRDMRDAAWEQGDWKRYSRLDAELRRIPQSSLWEEHPTNLVTTLGKNFLLDNGFSQNFVSTYMMLMSNVSYTTGAAVGDTMASHGGWTESTAYSNSTRIVTAWSAGSSGSKALSAALSFSINASDTIKGAGLTTVSTKGGTTGTLYSMGLFTGGDQPVVNGNTLNVSYTASA